LDRTENFIPGLEHNFLHSDRSDHRYEISVGRN